MKKLVLICGILASALTVGYSAMSKYEIKRVMDNWVKNEDKNTFKAMIDESLASVEQCKEEGKDSCLLAGVVYSDAGYSREAIPYFEKNIALGDNGGYHLLGLAYYGLDDYLNAKKYYEISCNTNNDGQALSCHSLGIMYSRGQGVKQYHSIAKQYAGKACDLGEEMGCYDYKRYNEAGVQ